MQSATQAHRLYDPLARYLSSALGRPVVFRPARAWWIYQDRVQKGRYDIVLDGPQFTGWRMARLGYKVVARARNPVSLDIVVRARSVFRRPRDLAGQTLCATPPPSLAGLVAEQVVADPVAQPHLLDAHGPRAVIEAVRHGLCAAGVVPAGVTLHSGLRVLRRESFPGQAFSVSPVLGHKVALQLRTALLATTAKSVLRPLIQTYSMGGLRAASGHASVGSANLLQSTWGFYPISLLR